jgi:Tol biopolymer transport system component
MVGGNLLFLRRPVLEFDGPQPESVEIVPALGGPTVVLGLALDAAWAADGRSVHLVSQDAECISSLTTVEPNGTVLATVHAGLKELDSGFVWSPDGAQVAFLRFHNGPPPKSCGSQGGADGPDESVQDLMLMDADGGGLRVLIPTFWPSRPLAWSPDGTRILVPNAVMSLDGPTATFLVGAADGARTPLAATFADLSSPRWSPDGSRLACTFLEDGRHLGVIAIASTVPVDLGLDDRATHEPSWSPDGTSLAAAFDLNAADGSYTGGDIAIRGADGAPRHVLGLKDVQVFSQPPSWSPDGTRLAYVATHEDGGGYGGIALIGVDGGERTAIPNTEGAEWVAWQPALAGDH